MRTAQERSRHLVPATLAVLHSFVVSCFSSGLALADSSPAAPTGGVHFRMQRSANIDKVLVNSHEEPFALLLAEGSVVMLSSNASDFGFAPGQRVQVEGDAVETALNVVYYRARLTRGGKLLLRANDAPARQPSHEACAGNEVTARGALEALLGSPDGRITGMVFADGTMALVGPAVTLDASGLFRGANVEVSGPAIVADRTTVLRIDRLALATR